MVKGMENHGTKRISQNLILIWGDAQTDLVIREIQIKATARCNFVPVRHKWESWIMPIVDRWGFL